MRTTRLMTALLPIGVIPFLAMPPATSDPAFPVSIQNCGISTTYTRAPQRAFTMNQAATEIMLALGLHERMVGTAFLDDAILPEFSDAYETISMRSAGYPSGDQLAAARPDFVYAAYSSAFSDEVPGMDDLLRAGTDSYLSPSGCEGRPGQASMDLVFDEIRDIGRIFGVLPRAEQLIAGYRAALDSVRERLGTVDAPRRVLWYDSGTPPSVGACCGAPAEILRLAGGQNIFSDVPGSWTRVGWDEVVERNPDVIVLVDAAWAPAAQKRQWLSAMSARAGIAAVEHRRFVIVDFSDSTPGIRIISTVRKLAEALYPEKFGKPEQHPAPGRKQAPPLIATVRTSPLTH